MEEVSCPVDGQWSLWGSYGVCDANGKKQRTRSCTKPAPLNGGKQCSGSSKEEVSCECAEGWSSYGESCYRLYGTQEQLTWAEAQAECQKQNSNLAIARDENVVLFLGGLQGNNRIWLGAQRQPGSDPAVGWTLVDGSPLSFQNWRQGEPTGGNELCLEQYSQQHQLKWNDVPIQVAKATSSSSYNNDFLPDF